MAVFIFLSYLAAGLTVSLAVVRLGYEARRFIRFNAAMTLAIGGSATAMRLLGPENWGWSVAIRLAPWAASATALMLALLAIYLLLAAFGRDPRSLLRLAAVAAVASVLFDAHARFPSSRVELPAGVLLHVLNAGTSAWLAGSILLAMILGHFYLVMPRMSIEPLRALFRFSVVGLGFRILLVTTAGVLWWMGSGENTITVASFLREGVFVLQRVLFGLVVPASLTWFTYKTIEMRSTQSATGILYVVVFLTLVGEALSVYLSLETAVPL